MVSAANTPLAPTTPKSPPYPAGQGGDFDSPPLCAIAERGGRGVSVFLSQNARVR